MSDAITGVNTTEYMQLFMQELTYQDPMKPVDNKEFMSQMAQFSALQQAQETNGLIDKLIGVTVGSQAMNLLGKTVQLLGSNELKKITTVQFEENEQPKLTAYGDGQSIDVILGEISKVQL